MIQVILGAGIMALGLTLGVAMTIGVNKHPWHV